MEFNEKLQELRRMHNLTQEELAKILYVSRSAVSKWESNRGLPDINSIKTISKYFNITIDELLDSDKILEIAQDEQRVNTQVICNFIIGILDILSLMLIIFPLYPKVVGDYVYAVNLINYHDTSLFILYVYWMAYVFNIFLGVINLMLLKFNLKYSNIIINISMVTNVIIVLILSLTGKTYAIALMFVLLLVKSIMYIKKLQ